MTFQEVCRLSDLKDSMPVQFTVDGTAIAVVRVAHEVFAVNDTCTHGQVSLAEGEVDDCTLECWLHGSRFDLRTGAPTGLPATQPIAVYEVRLEGVGPDAQVLVAVNN